MAQTKGKYWLANNPNAEITNAEVTELGSISETDFGVVSDLTASASVCSSGFMSELQSQAVGIIR